MGSREIRFCLFPIIPPGIALTLACLIAAAPSIALAQPGQTDLEQMVRSLVWQQGPTQVLMGDVAQLQVPLGYKFTGTPGASRMMSAMGNQPSATLIGMLVANDGRFVMSFDFDPIGHVPDDERHQLEAGRILASIQHGTEEANAWRRQNGHAELTVTGWWSLPIMMRPLTISSGPSAARPVTAPLSSISTPVSWNAAVCWKLKRLRIRTVSMR